jgi:hypothetical protein
MRPYPEQLVGSVTTRFNASCRRCCESRAHWRMNVPHVWCRAVSDERGRGRGLRGKSHSCALCHFAVPLSAPQLSDFKLPAALTAASSPWHPRSVAPSSWSSSQGVGAA